MCDWVLTSRIKCDKVKFNQITEVIRLKKVIKVFMMLMVLGVTINLSGCGNSKEVPESILMLYVEDCSDYDEDNDNIFIEYDHEYDSDAQMDTVLIKLSCADKYGCSFRESTVRYLYDKSTGLWALAKNSSWSSREYEFNDNLIGEWKISDEFVLNITEVKDAKVELRYRLNGMAYDKAEYDRNYGGAPTIPYELIGNATAIIEEDYLKFSIQLPDDYYYDRYSENSTRDISVKLCIDKGIEKNSLYEDIELWYYGSAQE